VEGVSIGHATGQNPGSPRQPPMAPAERLGPHNGGRAGTPCGAPFIAAVRPLCDAEKSEGRDGVLTAGSTLYAARVARQRMDRRSMAAWPTGEGRRGTWQGMTSRRLGVLPASGRGSLGKARAGSDAKAAVQRARARRRAGARVASRLA
jgi:hypothetical protein